MPIADRRGNTTRMYPMYASNSERVKNGHRKKREGEEVEGDLRLGRKRVNMGISETCACGESIHVQMGV